MKVKMLAYHTTKDGAEHNPGALVDFDDAEAQRQIEIGGARALTEAEIAAELEREVAANAAAGKGKAKPAA